MSDEPVFFDYESDEYKSLKATYDVANQEHKLISDRYDAARKAFSEAEIDFIVSQKKLLKLWEPISVWHWEQNALRNEWMREQQDKEPGNE